MLILILAGIIHTLILAGIALCVIIRLLRILVIFSNERKRGQPVPSSISRHDLTWSNPGEFLSQDNWGSLIQDNWGSLVGVIRRRPSWYREDVENVTGVAPLCSFFFLMVGAILSIPGEVDFGKYVLYVVVIPYIILGMALLIPFLVLWSVRYAQKKREARTTPDHEAILTALDAGRVSEAMRLYKEVNCLNEANVKPALQQVLAGWPILNTIYEATSELLALQRNSFTALTAGVPQSHVELLTEVSENALNTIWIITDRVVAVRRQNVDSPRIQRALGLQEQRIRNLAKAAREARENLAESTLHGWEGQDIEKAQEKLKDLVTGLRELMDTSDTM